jgi:hypothetical protein
MSSSPTRCGSLLLAFALSLAGCDSSVVEPTSANTPTVFPAVSGAVVTLLGAPDLVRQPLPFKGDLEGRHVSRTPLTPPFVSDVFEMTGTATQLGRVELVIETVANFGAFPVTGVGTSTFTAANGDKLVADNTGASALVRPGLVLITERNIIDPDRSTGRFAGATGTFTLTRLADAATGVTGVTSGSFEGKIVLATPLKR